MSGVSKLEYLKRYMDGNANEGKRKKKKKRISKLGGNIKIMDFDITFKDMKRNSDEDDEFDLQEEKPILYADDGATIITKVLAEKEKNRKAKWAPLNVNSNKFKESVGKSHDGSSGSDLSPVRTSRNRHDSSGDDLSPIRTTRKRHDSNGSDMSPVRSRKRHDSSGSDFSPIRQNKDNSDSDISPIRRRQNNISDDDASPIRHGDTKSRKKGLQNRKEEVPEVMSAGKKSGLQTGSELKKENEIKRKMEMKLINDMDASVSGKGAGTVYRDRKTGKKIDLKFEEMKKKRQEEEKLKETEKHALWGKGVTQAGQYEEKLHDDMHEMEKPLARYKDDKDLDILLKKQNRDGDPMLAFLTKKKEKKNAQAKPRYNGPAPPPNRFNIWPGYRYDGVDRSNGFEKKRFMAINKEKSLKTDAYKWSVEDM